MPKKQIYIGAHSSMAKGFYNAVQYIHSIGGNATQVFLKSPRGRISKPLDKNDIIETNKYLKQSGGFLVGHCSYLLNFAKKSSTDPWAVISLIDDMEKISTLGGVGIVLHIGKYLELDKKEVLKNIKTNVSEVIKKSPKDVKVIFENTAGQGTEIGYLIEDLSEIYHQFSTVDKKRIGFCLDTCHAFAAGYDLSTTKGVKEWYNKFNKLIGWDKVVCMHFNDAKKECGSRVDRHEDLGAGMIGIKGLKEISKLAYKTDKPLILETLEKAATYEEQIAMVKRWNK